MAEIRNGSGKKGRGTGGSTSKRKRKTTRRRGKADSGAESLAKAVDAVMSEKCKELAEALVNAAVEGNMSCAKIAITISERQWQEEEERRNKEQSKSMGIAERWANEPVWAGREPEFVKAERLKRERWMTGSNANVGSAGAGRSSGAGSTEESRTVK